MNISIVYSSWYDWSRYEHEGYSFKIPEGYKVSSELQADWGDDYLVEDWGYNDPGSRIYIYTNFEDITDYYTSYSHIQTPENPDNFKEMIKYNDSAIIYTDGKYDIIGEYKTENGTTIIIDIYHSSLSGEFNNEKIEEHANIIKELFDSVRTE